MALTTTTSLEIDIANNAELRANAQHVLAFTRDARPRNTTVAYEPKQREFQVSRQAARQLGSWAARLAN